MKLFYVTENSEPKSKARLMANGHAQVDHSKVIQNPQEFSRGNVKNSEALKKW